MTQFVMYEPLNLNKENYTLFIIKMDNKAIEIQKVKKDIEVKTESEIKTNGLGTYLRDPDKCIALLKKGEAEFVQKTGRNMTYSEMREMFG